VHRIVIWRLRLMLGSSLANDSMTVRISNGRLEVMATRKRRTREHIVEDLSENHLERLVLNAGHLLRRPRRDYGVDVTMFHFSEFGELENGEVRFQLKATDNLTLVLDGQYATVRVKTGDIQYWSMEFYPFILVLYDAKEETAFWIGIEDILNQPLDLDQQTETIRIPVSNELTRNSVEHFRKMSLAVIENLGNHNDDEQSRPR
jgi:hypothetical protein